MLSWSTSLLALPALLFAYSEARRIHRRFLGRTPPGPKGWPIVGNAYDIPHDKAWLTYTEWGKLYGDIIYIENFGSPTVILNDLEDVRELLDRRSAITASRPRMVMADELMEWNWDFGHMPHDDYWRQHRKVFHQYFQQKNTSNFYPAISKSMSVLLNQLVESPDNFQKHTRQLVSSIIWRLTYDHEVVSEDDYYVALAHRAVEGLSRVLHVGSSIVDVVPPLKYIPAWFPLVKFKKLAQENAKCSADLRDIPFSEAKERVVSECIGSCFVSESLSRDDADEKIIKNTAGITYLAGSAPTISIIVSFFLAMLHHPEVQIRARAEIDSVTEGNRLPDFEDRPSLPYIELLMAELFRWVTPAPLAFAHQSQQPDVYKGYYLPAGTTFIPNVWGIFHDKTRFSDPEKFWPERFLEENANFDPCSMGVFGYGRRICPARYLAHSTAWLAIVQILASFNIVPKQDEKGRDILAPPEFMGRLLINPAQFDVGIIPRSPQALELIRQMATVA